MTVSNSRFIYDTFPAFFMSWNSRLIFQYRPIILDLVQPCPADMDGIFSSLLSDNIDLQDNVVKDNAKSDLSGQSVCFQISFSWLGNYLFGIGHMSSLTVIFLLVE